MKKNVLGFVTALNTVALVGVVAVSMTGDDGPHQVLDPSGEDTAAAKADALEARIAALEERLASEPALAAEVTPRSTTEPEQGTPSASAEADAAAVAPEDDRPVTRSEIGELVKAQLAAQADVSRRKWAEAAKAKRRPKKTLAEVARELQLDPRQETAIRTLYRDLERQSIQTLFAVEAEELESIKAQIAQSEHDPRLKAELRERIAVNWTRNGKEISVLYVQLDAQLRRIMDSDTLASFYRNDVQLAEPEFPDITATFFPEKLGSD